MLLFVNKNMQVVFNIFLLTFNNGNVLFSKKELIWKIYHIKQLKEPDKSNLLIKICLMK